MLWWTNSLLINEVVLLHFENWNISDFFSDIITSPKSIYTGSEARLLACESLYKAVFRIMKVLGVLLTLALTSRETAGNFIGHYKFQFPHLWTQGNNNIDLKDCDEDSLLVHNIVFAILYALQTACSFYFWYFTKWTENTFSPWLLSWLSFWIFPKVHVPIVSAFTRFRNRLIEILWVIIYSYYVHNGQNINW